MLQFRQKYITTICEYRQRLNAAEIREDNPLYIRKIKAQINVMEIDLLMTEEILDRLYTVDSAIKAFFGHHVKKGMRVNCKANDRKHKPNEYNLSKGMFYKYCLERGMCGADLQFFTGDKARSGPINSRKNILKDPKKLEIYRNFVNFVETNKEKYIIYGKEIRKYSRKSGDE